jgi:hypothetical protein
MTRSPSCARRLRSPRALHLAHSDCRMIVPRLRGRRGPAKRGLELVLGEPSAQLTTASRELLRAGLCGPMHGMVAPAVAASCHREGILPCRHEGLELARRASQFCLQAFSNFSFHGALSSIESAAPDCTMSHRGWADIRAPTPLARPAPSPGATRYRTRPANAAVLLEGPRVSPASSSRGAAFAAPSTGGAVRRTAHGRRAGPRSRRVASAGSRVPRSQPRPRAYGHPGTRSAI